MSARHKDLSAISISLLPFGCETDQCPPCIFCRYTKVLELLEKNYRTHCSLKSVVSLHCIILLTLWYLTKLRATSTRLQQR